MEVFNLNFEFQPEQLLNTIDKRIESKKPGYVCVVDSSVLARTKYEPDYLDVVRGAFVNACDGSSIALMVKMLYGGNPQVFNGPQIFAHYIESNHKQVVLGNTEEMFDNVVAMLKNKGKWNNQLVHIPLPFLKVEEFDYKGIADKINEIQPDIIWVSLGNPKQERFMGLVLPHINQGVMFGIGAALNFCTGDLKLPDFHVGPLKFIWLTRIFQDPKRQIKGNWKILKTLPSIYKEEKIKKKNKNV